MPFSEWKNMVESELTVIPKTLEYPDGYNALSVDEYLPAIFTGELKLIKEGEKELVLFRRQKP